jgi:glycosyltransferase involved in cell wall biosynthesis
VRALAGEHVNVTGTVADVRPYLQHAAAVVAPLRLARGIQNKILEAMAMQQPVVAAQVCVEAIDATPGEHLLAAHDTADYLQALNTLLADADSARRIGLNARRCVLQAYAWDARLATLDDALLSALTAHAPVREAA